MTDKCTEPQVPAGLTKADVSSQALREYIYTDGFGYAVREPITLYIKRKPEGESHRVVDKDGLVHYIPAGWRILRWRNKPDRPEVEF